MTARHSEGRHRARARRRRGLTRLLLALSLFAALVAAIIVVTGGRPIREASSAPLRPVHPTLHPPGPIPGYLLIADRGNNRMLLVDSSRHIYWRYPGGGRKAMPFVFDDDTFFGPGHDRIISNQEDQNTIQIISFPGKHVLWRYGHVNVKSGAAGYLHTPDDAYLLPNHLISVADAYNCRVLFIAGDHTIVRQYGTTGVCRHDPPRYLGAVNGATPLRDGGTLVSEIAGSWIDDIGPTGRLRWSVQAPVAYPSDPQLLSANRILLADYSKPGAAIIMTRSGRVIWRYGPSGGPGALDHPSLATRIGPGLIAINDDYRDRVVIVSVHTGKIVWQYGHTDQPGTSSGYLNTPDGLDLLATRTAQALPNLRSLFTRHKAPSPATSVRSGQEPTVRVTVPFHLPAPVEREVAVSHGGAIFIAGGLDAAGNSTDGVFRMTADSPVLTSLGSVPEAFHDAAGAVIGDGLFVFGGGAAQSSSAVQRFDLATHTAKIVAQLPRPLSDIASTSTPRGVYLVGGYDGHVPRREIYRTSDGFHFHEVARLPVGLRYPAVAALGDTVVIAGGTSIAGASDRVYLLNTKTGVLTTFGHLPAATAHAQAFTLGSAVYVGGGVGNSGTVTGAVYRVDPAARRVSRAAGFLAVRDGATVTFGDSALVLGGATSAGTTATVRRITAR